MKLVSVLFMCAFMTIVVHGSRQAITTTKGVIESITPAEENWLIDAALVRFLID